MGKGKKKLKPTTLLGGVKPLGDMTKEEAEKLKWEWLQEWADDERATILGHAKAADWFLGQTCLKLINGRSAEERTKAAWQLIDTIDTGCQMLEIAFTGGDKYVKDALAKASRKSEWLPIRMPAQKWNKKDKTTGEQMMLELPVGEDGLRWNTKIKRDRLNRLLIDLIKHLNRLRDSDNDCNLIARSNPERTEWVSKVANLEPLCKEVAWDWAHLILEHMLWLDSPERSKTPFTTLFVEGSWSNKKPQTPFIGLLAEGSWINKLSHSPAIKREAKKALKAARKKLLAERARAIIDEGKSSQWEYAQSLLDANDEKLKEVDTDPKRITDGLKRTIYKRLLSIIGT